MKTLTADQLKMVLSGPRHAKIIDVLPPEHFEKEHIENATNIPVTDPDFVDRVEEITEDKTHSVILYCADADCDASPTAARKLEDAGFTNVYDFEGGIDAWKKAGYDTASHAGADR